MRSRIGINIQDAECSVFSIKMPQRGVFDGILGFHKRVSLGDGPKK